MCIIISLEWNIQLTVHRYPAKYIQIVVCRLKLMICCFTNLFILKTSFLLPFMTCLKSEYTSLFRFISKSNKKDSSCKNLKPLQHSHTNLFLICHKIQTKSPTLILLLYSTDCSFLQRWSVSVSRCITNQNSISLLTIIVDGDPIPAIADIYFYYFLSRWWGQTSKWSQ